MADEFTYRSYDTSYQFSEKLQQAGEKVDETTLRKYNHAACFSSFFSNCEGPRHIIVEIHSGTKYLMDKHCDNACLFTKAEMENHIKEAKKVIDFDFTISRKKRLPDGYWGYEVYLDINSNKIAEKYLVTWVRYLYEFPFNVSLLDVYRMKDLSEFNDMTIENLLLIVLNSHIVGDGWVRGIHSVPKPRHGKFYTTEELKKKINSLDDSKYLNDIYPQSFKCIDLSEGSNSLARWLDEEKFKKRCENYLKVRKDNE